MTADTAPRGAARTHGGRLDFLDALRGIAAVLVVIQHSSERVQWRPALWFSIHVAQLGQLGVMVFFLVSGFIIPVSLERHGNLRSFWVARGFRLYPLYWASLVAVYVLWHYRLIGVAAGVRQHPTLAFLANVTMASRVFRQPYALGLYWTLLFELIFYVACSVLFVLGWLRRSDRIAVILMALIVAKSYAPLLVGGHASPSALPFVAMVTGTVLFRVFSGELPRRRASAIVAAAVATGILSYAPLIGRHHATVFYGGDSFVPMTGAFVGAIAIALVGLTMRNRGVPRAMRYLGLVSYSIYLVHPLLLPWIALPHVTGLAVAAFLGITVACASVSYRLIEAPAIGAGRRIVHRLERSKTHEVAVTTTTPST